MVLDPVVLLVDATGEGVDRGDGTEFVSGSDYQFSTFVEAVLVVFEVEWDLDGVGDGEMML